MARGTNVLLLVALLVAQAPLIEPSVAQAPRPADLSIAHVTVTKAPRWVFDEPTEGLVSVRVQNLGDTSAGYQLLFEWESEGSRAFLHEDDLRSTDIPDEGALGGRASRTHEFRWRPQPGQAGAGNVVVSVTGPGGAPADTNPGNDRGLGPTHVTRMAAAVEVTGAPPPLHRGETAFLRVQLHNEGNAAFTAELALADRTHGNRTLLDTAIEPPTLVAPAGRTSVATIFLTLPADVTDLSALKLNYSLRANMSFGRSLNASTPTVSIREGAAPDNHTFALEGPGDDEVFVPRMGNTEAILHLTNTGGLDDTYRLSLRPDGGWSADTSTPRMGLLPGERRDVRIRLGSGDLPNGAAGLVDLHLASEHGRAAWSGQLRLRVSGPAVVVESVHAVPAEWYVGEAASVQVRLRNHGDAPSGPEAAATVRVLLPSQTVPQAIVLRPRLAPGGHADVVAAVGTAGQGGAASLTAEWSPDGVTTPAAPVSSGAFVHAPVLEVEGPAVEGLGMAGESVAYRDAERMFRVTNRGNAAELLQVSAVATAGSVRFESAPSFRLDVGASRNIALVHDLPAATVERRHANVTVTVAVDSHPAFFAWANATSRIEDVSAPVVTVTSPPAERWTLGVPISLVVVATDAARVTNASLRLVGPGGLVVPMTLEGRPDGTWQASYRAPRAGNYTVRAWAADLFGNVGTSAPRVIEVLPIPLPSVTILEPRDGGLVGNGTPLRLRFEEASGPLHARIGGGILEDGSAFSMTITPSGALVNVSLPALRPATVELFVEAWNDYGGSAFDSVNVTVAAMPPSPQSEAARPADEKDSETTPANGPLLAALGVVLGVVVARRATRRP